MMFDAISSSLFVISICNECLFSSVLSLFDQFRLQLVSPDIPSYLPR